MKKLISILAMVGLAYGAHAVEHKSFPLLIGQNLALSNNVTITPTNINLYYISPGLTNVSSLTTNTAGNIVPTPISSSSAFADENGNAGTIVFGFRLNMTNFVLGPNQNVLITTNTTNLFTPTATSTNTVTFTLGRSCMGDTNFGTTAGDKFTFSVNAGGIAGGIWYTNLPTAFTSGAKRIGILSIQSSDATNSPVGVIVNWAALSGFAP